MKNIAGIMGVYTDPNKVIKAAGQIRMAGYKKFDFHTPYPLHGLDDAMGIRKTVLPYISLAAGLLGSAMAIHMQWWTGAVDYKLVIGGKPLFAIESSVPIMFELTVLLCAVATVVAMFAMNGLPKWFNRYQNDPHFLLSTDDAFVVTIDSDDPQFHGERTKEFLESLGAAQVRLVESNEE